MYVLYSSVSTVVLVLSVIWTNIVVYLCICWKKQIVLTLFMSMLFKKVILSQVSKTIVLFPWPEFSPNIIYFKTGNIYVKSLEKTKYSMYYIFEQVIWKRINKFLHDLKLFFSCLHKLRNKTTWGMGSACALKLFFSCAFKLD